MPINGSEAPFESMEQDIQYQEHGQYDQANGQYDQAAYYVVDDTNHRRLPGCTVIGGHAMSVSAIDFARSLSDSVYRWW